MAKSVTCTVQPKWILDAEQKLRRQMLVAVDVTQARVGKETFVLVPTREVDPFNGRPIMHRQSGWVIVSIDWSTVLQYSAD